MRSLDLSCSNFSLDFLIIGESVHPDSNLVDSRLSLLTSRFLWLLISTHQM